MCETDWTLAGKVPENEVTEYDGRQFQFVMNKFRTKVVPCEILMNDKMKEVFRPLKYVSQNETKLQTRWQCGKKTGSQLGMCNATVGLCHRTFKMIVDEDDKPHVSWCRNADMKPKKTVI